MLIINLSYAPWSSEDGDEKVPVATFAKGAYQKHRLLSALPLEASPDSSILKVRWNVRPWTVSPDGYKLGPRIQRVGLALVWVQDVK